MTWQSLVDAGERAVLRILFEDVVWNHVRDFDNGCIVSFLPGFLKPGTDGLQAEDFELLLGLFVFLEFLEERSLTQLLQVTCFVRVGHVPAIFRLLLQRRIVRELVDTITDLVQGPRKVSGLQCGFQKTLHCIGTGPIDGEGAPE